MWERTITDSLWVLYFQTISQLEVMLRMAEDERDHYKRECEIMRSISRSRPNSRASSPIRAGSPDKVSIFFFLWGIHDRFQQRTSEIMSIVGSPVLVPRI